SVALFALYLFALARWTASAMSYVTLLFPMATVVLAVLLLGEEVTPALLFGGAVVLGGVYVGAFSRPRPRASTATSDPSCLPIDDCPPPPTARAREFEVPARP
ncbi:MAG TPA: DMT family transporter, partial [Acidimicrobiia bacterium]|nr:DMT family transporter [Acidimicrobiia bacterium]